MTRKWITLILIFTITIGTVLHAQNHPGKMKLIPLKKFKSLDIGNQKMKGNTELIADGLNITAGGADIWGNNDEFYFSYIEWKNDFDFVVRMDNLSDTHLYTKAGIMAREELSADSRHVYFQVFPTNNERNNNNGGCEFQYRLEKAGQMKAIYPENATGTPTFSVDFPHTRIRLKRTGNKFISYFSNDGINWKVYSEISVDLPEKIYLGLAVTSHHSSKIAIAKFREIGTYQ